VRIVLGRPPGSIPEKSLWHASPGALFLFGLAKGSGPRYNRRDMSTHDERVSRLNTLLSRCDYTDAEIDEIKSLMAQGTPVQPQTFLRDAQFRATLESIQTIRKFDKASGKLGKIVLVFTIVAVIGTLVQATYAVLSYYWPLHR
jgi:hypothetical protein